MKKHWLVTYSQKNENGNTLSANIVLDVRPEVWLLVAVRRWPEANTILLFAMEISESMYNDLHGEI